MSSYVYDAAEKKPPLRAPMGPAPPSAPSFDSSMQPQTSVQYPYLQPQRKPSTSSMMYAQPVNQPSAHGYNVQAPMPSMPQQPGYFPQPKYYSRRYSDASSDDESSLGSFAAETGRLALFHALNGVLGYIAFMICVGGVGASVATLPLCCFGIVLFRVVLYAVYGFAQLDVMLYNFISLPEERVYVQVPENPRTLSLSGQRLSPSLSSFSPLSLMALIYFCTVKFLISNLSTFSFSLGVTAPLSLVCAVLGFRGGESFQIVLGPEDIVDFDSDPLLFIIATVCLFAIGVALMHLVAKASRESTKFFCCERFSTYRYVHQHGDPSAQFYPMAANAQPAYGAFATTNPQPPPQVVSYHSGGL